MGYVNRGAYKSYSESWDDGLVGNTTEMNRTFSFDYVVTDL